jgi:hypothetical protein
MPLTRRAHHALLATLALSALCACGDDSGRDTLPPGSKKDAGTDAATQPSTDAGKLPLPMDAGKDAGRDSGPPSKPPPPVIDVDTGVPSCDDVDCRGLTDDCNVGVCDPETLTCSAQPRADDTACSSDVLDNCTLPDRCRAGVCLARDVAKGTTCGDLSVECHIKDTCDGKGNCVDGGFLPPGAACGDAEASNNQCDAADSCNALGECSPNHKPVDTPCGDIGLLCRYADTCDGLGGCSDAGNWEAGASGGPNTCPGGRERINGACVCGSTSLNTCHPQADVCIDGTCVLGNLADSTPCGSQKDDECDNPNSCKAGVCVNYAEAEGTLCGDKLTDVECDRPDTCDGSGTCLDHVDADGTFCGGDPAECKYQGECNAGTCSIANKPANSVCSKPGDQCLIAVKCNASGVCVDGGEVDPCTVKGTLYLGRTSPVPAGAGIVVSVPGTALSDTTDATGAFELAMPLHQDLTLQVAPVSGYYGIVTGLNFTPQNAAYGLSPSLPSDAEVESPATTFSRTPDRAKGVLAAGFYGPGLDGGEGITLSATSAAAGPIVKTAGSAIQSSTLMSTQPSTMYLYDVQGSSTTITPNAGASGTCAVAYPGVTPWTVAPHTVTQVSVLCE